MKRLLILLTLLAGTAAPAETIEVLLEERAREVYGATLPDESEFEITVKGSRPEQIVMLAEFWMDLSTGQFLANAVQPNGDVRRIGGLALVSVPVPVPNRRLLPDEIVRAEDLTVERLPLGRVGGFAVIDPAKLIGKQVRRVLSRGRPVQIQSVIEPLVIDRGEKVTIQFRDGDLFLIAPGRALDDAHRGQDVRIVNLVSNKSLVGTATADGIVEIIR